MVMEVDPPQEAISNSTVSVPCSLFTSYTVTVYANLYVEVFVCNFLIVNDTGST